jgi:hypothetical protein
MASDVPSLAAIDKFAKDPSPAPIPEIAGAPSFATRINAFLLLRHLGRPSHDTLLTAIKAFGVTLDDVHAFARQEASRDHSDAMTMLMGTLLSEPPVSAEPAAKRVCRRPRLELQEHQRVAIYNAKGELNDFGHVVAVEDSKITVRRYLEEQVAGDPLLYVVDDEDPLGETCVFVADEDDRLVHEGCTLGVWTDKLQF